MVEEAWDKAVSSVNLMRSELRWMLERRRTMLLNFLDIELMRALYVIVWSLMRSELRGEGKEILLVILIVLIMVALAEKFPSIPL